MRRLFIVLAALSVSLSASAQFRTPDYNDLYDSEVVSSMKEQIRFLSSAALEGRKAGSQGEIEAAGYIAQELSSYGIELVSSGNGDVFGMKQADGDTLVSRNVVGYIPGYDKTLKDHYIVIGARMDNLGTGSVNVNGETVRRIYYGANGNASGLSMLLQLARRLSTNSVLLKRSVLLVAFGSSLNLGGGSWYFLNRSFPAPQNIDAMINLDMLGTGSNGFYAYTASNPDMNAIVTTLSGSLQPVQPRVVSLEPVNSDHRAFYDKEIPSIFFTTGMYPEYNTERDTESIIQYEEMEKELEYIYNFSVALVNGNRPEFRKSDETRRRYVDSKDVWAYSDCDVKPVFLGSSDPSVFLQKWVYVYLRYPDRAVRDGIQGRVLVDFVIDEKGKVRDVKIIKGLDPDLDDEVLRVVSVSPDWKPARVRGQKVKCEMSMYVEFRLKRNR